MIIMKGGQVIFSIVMLGIAGVILANVMPTALNAIADATLSTDLDAGVASMFQDLLPIILIFAVIIGLLNYMKNRDQ